MKGIGDFFAFSFLFSFSDQICNENWKLSSIFFIFPKLQRQSKREN